MNPKFFIADIVFLIAFIVQGMETHDSESSFIEISMPYAIAIVLIMSTFYKKNRIHSFILILKEEP